jgi:hypothetical protein
MSRKLKPAAAGLSGKLKNLFYAPERSSGFSSLGKLVADSPRGTRRAEEQTWLLKQDTYTLHRPVRKRFLRNPYNVTNILDVWECDLIDIQNFSIYNDKNRYLLSVIDVFYKFLHIVPLRVKTGTAVASAFRSILAQYSRRRPIWVRTDRGKKFLNSSFQDMLKKEGIQFQVCRDPNVKCSIVERSHRHIHDKLCKYMA